jgi:nucleoside-diphosphate-sugar epimerase
MARVLIAGCGYVGNRLGELLLSGGDVVFGLRRDVSRLAPGITPIAADLLDRATLRALPADLEFVVYSAAAANASDDAYRAAYVDGLRNLLVALCEQDQAPSRVLFTSSTGVFPQTDGSWVDESTPVDVPGRVDRVREGERLLATFPFPRVVVRFGGIYGPGRDRFVRSIEEGRLAVAKHPPRWTNRIHRDDCAAVLAHLLRLKDPHDLYVAVDDEPAPLFEVASGIAARLGAPLREPSGEAPRDEGKRCSNGRLKASGYVFRFPTWREGYAERLGPR